MRRELIVVWLITSRVVKQNFAFDPFFTDFRFDHDQSLIQERISPRNQSSLFQLDSFFRFLDKEIGFAFLDLAENRLCF